jgi:hypothetical protein
VFTQVETEEALAFGKISIKLNLGDVGEPTICDQACRRQLSNTLAILCVTIRLVETLMPRCR